MCSNKIRLMPVVSFTNCALFSVDKYAGRNGKTTSTSGPVAEGGRKINIGGSSCHNVSGATTNRGTIGPASLARENEAGGSWGQEIHILHVNI